MDQMPPLPTSPQTQNPTPPAPQTTPPAPQQPQPNQPQAQQSQSQTYPVNKPSIGFIIFAVLTIFLTLLGIPAIIFALAFIGEDGLWADVYMLRIPIVLILIIVYIVLSIKGKWQGHIITSVITLAVHILLTVTTVIGLLAVFR